MCHVSAPPADRSARPPGGAPPPPTARLRAGRPDREQHLGDRATGGNTLPGYRRTRRRRGRPSPAQAPFERRLVHSHVAVGAGCPPDARDRHRGVPGGSAMAERNPSGRARPVRKPARQNARLGPGHGHRADPSSGCKRRPASRGCLNRAALDKSGRPGGRSAGPSRAGVRRDRRPPPHRWPTMTFRADGRRVLRRWI